MEILQRSGFLTMRKINSQILFILNSIKRLGDTLKKDEVLATIESVKAAADVNSPISGKITEVNESLTDTPETLNDDPYEKGWLYTVELDNPSELDDLLDAYEYDAFCESRH